MNCPGKEKSKLQLNTRPLHLRKQLGTRKVPLNGTRQKPKLVPAVCLGNAHQSALGKLHAEVAVAVGARSQGQCLKRPQATPLQAGAGNLEPGSWENPGLPASESAPREASGRTPWQPPGAQDRKWSLGLTGTRKRK